MKRSNARKNPPAQTAKQLIREWWGTQDKREVQTVRHIHTHCYVVGYAAPACLVVACPWMQSEPLNRDWDRENPLTTINRFDRSLKAGDWCITGYVRTDTCGESVAIRIPARKNPQHTKEG